MTTEWKAIPCADCSGKGIVSGYKIGGGNFTGPTVCVRCNGNSIVWQSPKGALAKYPGGPFIGFLPKAKASP